MEEILQNLIKSYSEKKLGDDEGKQFKLYSNLSVTQPLQQKCEFKRRIEKGIQFLSARILTSSEKIGLQSHFLQTKPNFETSSEGEAQFDSLLNSKSDTDTEASSLTLSHSSHLVDQYTSILALDVLGDSDRNDAEAMPSFSSKVIQSLINFILPESGVSTFGIFKSNQNMDLLLSSSTTPRPNSATSSSGCSSTAEFETYHRSSSSLSEMCDKEINPIIVTPLGDDCNTTALALSVLLREGILDIKPTGSVTELLLSNVGDDDFYPGVIRAFFNGRDTIDAVSCANVLYLYYILSEDIEESGSSVSLNYAENVESTQQFLSQILNSLLLSQNDDHNNDVNNSTHFALHHSPDALLYALSRCTTISNEARNRFTQPLISLLETRIGGTSSSGPLSLAMRILSADSLGLLGPSGIWIRRKLEGECCKLASYQDQSDGGWPIDSLIKVNLTNGSQSVPEQDVYLGGRELSTVFACRALQVFCEAGNNNDDVKFEAKSKSSQNYYGY